MQENAEIERYKLRKKNAQTLNIMSLVIIRAWMAQNMYVWKNGIQRVPRGEAD